MRFQTLAPRRSFFCYNTNMNKRLQKQILTVVAKDQAMRFSGKWDAKIDRNNTKTLKKIIKKYGWPDIALVGKKASQGAWLIAQHADHDVKFQKYCLKLITERLKDRKIDPKNFAYLTDRVLVNSGKLQLYGTQFYLNKKGQLVPRSIKNKKELSKRRKKFYLEPFTKYKARLMNKQKLFKKQIPVK